MLNAAMSSAVIDGFDACERQNDRLRRRLADRRGEQRSRPAAVAALGAVLARRHHDVAFAVDAVTGLHDRLADLRGTSSRDPSRRVRPTHREAAPRAWAARRSSVASIVGLDRLGLVAGGDAAMRACPACSPDGRALRRRPRSTGATPTARCTLIVSSACRWRTASGSVAARRRGSMPEPFSPATATNTPPLQRERRFLSTTVFGPGIVCR